MAEKQLSDGGADGTVMGQSATDLIAFHGATPADQYTTISLATDATAGTVRTAVRSILSALTEKGLIAGGP